MTGVAAQLCGESNCCEQQSLSQITIGQRWAVLGDLSPIATFIGSNLLRNIDRKSDLVAVQNVCSQVEGEYGQLYKTQHSGWKVRDRKCVVHKHYQYPASQQGSIEFVLYSDVVSCPECTSETTLYSVMVDEQSDSFRPLLTCPHCKAEIPEAKWELVYTTLF